MVRLVELKKYEPDELDINCNRVFSSISHIKTTKEKIELLEQVIDYLRMELLEQNISRKNENV